MTNMSMLMLGGGKRVSLAKRFKNAASRLGINLKIYAYEIDCLQPISLIAEVIEGKKWADDSVCDDIKTVLISKEIDFVIANVDQATKVLAKLKSVHKSACITNSVDIVEMCLSKKRMQSQCESKGINIIPIAKEGEFPCFVKPDMGSSSKGAKIVSTQGELDFSRKIDSSLIVQRFINGDEYTVDCYVSMDGNICGISPRIRLDMSGGESVVTKTILDEGLTALTRIIIERFGFVGPLTLQYIVDRKSKDVYFMEVNPRFGGGVIASIESGYDYPMMMLSEVLGETPCVVSHGRNVLMKRYYEEVFF